MCILGIAVVTCGTLARKILNAIVMTSSRVLRTELASCFNYKDKL